MWIEIINEWFSFQFFPGEGDHDFSGTAQPSCHGIFQVVGGQVEYAAAGNASQAPIFESERKGEAMAKA